MEKNIKNTDVITCKLKFILIRAINYRLEAIKDENQKKEQIIKKQKIKTIVKEIKKKFICLIKKKKVVG